MTLIAFQEEDLEKVRRVMKQLFMERRMDGDQMRDAAQTLESFLRDGIPFDPDTMSGEKKP